MLTFLIVLAVCVGLWVYAFVGHFFFRLITKDVSSYDIDTGAPFYYGGGLLWPITLVIHLFFIWPPKILEKIENWHENKDKNVVKMNNK